MSIFDYENKITKESLKDLGFEDILPSCKDILMSKTFVLRYNNKDFIGSAFTMNLTLVIIESYGKIRMEVQVDHMKVAKYPIYEMGDVTFAIEDIKKRYQHYVFVRYEEVLTPEILKQHGFIKCGPDRWGVYWEIL